MDTCEWPECNSNKATVGSVVGTVYMDGQPYKPCSVSDRLKIFYGIPITSLRHHTPKMRQFDFNFHHLHS